MTATAVSYMPDAFTPITSLTKAKTVRLGPREAWQQQSLSVTNLDLHQNQIKMRTETAQNLVHHPVTFPGLIETLIGIEQTCA